MCECYIKKYCIFFDTTSISYDSIMIEEFKHIIWDYYRTNGRSFVWRDTDNPYHILVSEIMLQQTQTDRVTPKFENFITCFPTIEILANATLKEVLSAWQGLGYNRRGMYLHQLAQLIVTTHEGIIPASPSLLEQLPGIGYATARSICAFAFNQPTVFIETNIRTVFIHHFFKNQNDISDKQIIPLVQETVDHANPRHWYYALMDYGVMLKKNFYNPSRRSKHHTKQSSFEGSDRQLRGKIIRILLEKSLTKQSIIELCNEPHLRMEKIINKMIQEKIINNTNDYLAII